jgi:hypothetical protein
LAAVAVVGVVALSASGLGAANAATAAGKPALSPASGPVGTAISVDGSCGSDALGGDWLKPEIGLAFADAFETTGGPSMFASSTGTIKADGSYSGTIKVPAKASYTAQGSGPADPKEVKNKPVSGQIRVVVLCHTSITPYPLSQEFRTFSVSAAKSLVLKTKPAISGKAKVGKKLKASKGSWSPKPTSYAYQWFRGKKPIEAKKATKRKYKVTAADKGKKLRVQVTAERPGYPSASAKSKAVKIKK